MSFRCPLSQLDQYGWQFKRIVETTFAPKLYDDILLNGAKVQPIVIKSNQNYAAKLIKILTNCTGLHIGSDDHGQPTQFSGPTKRLRFHNPLSSKRACCTLLTKVASVISMTATLVCLIDFALLLYHDLLVVKLYKNRLNRRTTLDVPILDCAIGGAVSGFMSSHSRSYRNKLLNIDLLIDRLDPPGSSVLVFAMFSYGYSLLTAITLIVLSLCYFTGETPLDSLNYVLNPTGECHRLEEQLRNLIIKVRLQAENFHCFRQTDYCRLFGKNTSSKTKLGTSITGDTYADQIVEFNQILNVIKDNNLVRPQIFCVSVLTRTLAIWRLEGIMLVQTICYLSIMPIGFFLMDVYNRTDARIHQSICYDWNPKSVFAKHHVHLNSNLSSERLNLTDYDGSLKSRLILMVEFELFRGVNWRSTAQVLLAMFQVVYLMLSVSLFISLIAPSAIMTRAWIKQLDLQLTACLEIIDHPMPPQDAGPSNGPDNSNIDEFIFAITATYVNFELFREEQEKHRQITNNCCTVVALVTTAGTILVVFIERYIATFRTSILLIIMLENLFVINLFFIILISMTNSTSKLYKMIFKLLARVSSHELELHHSADLWRRQLFDRHNMVEFFAPRISGLQMSRATLISSNIYAAGFLLYILFST